MMKEKKLIIGLTGSIGMGKSTVAKMFADEGFFIFNADQQVHALIKKGGRAVFKIAESFPESYENNAINHAKLGQIIFKDNRARAKLESILHPFVWESMDGAFIEAERKNKKGLVCDIPLLFETKADKKCDVTLCVFANEKKQKGRVMRRKGMTLEKFRLIQKSQLPDQEKMKRADFVIRTDTTPSQTRKQVREIIQEISIREKT